MPKTLAGRTHSRPKGSVREIVRGKKYQVRKTIGYDATTGKPITRAATVLGTKADADAKLAEMMADAEAGRRSGQPLHSITLGAVAEEWWSSAATERTQQTNRERAQYFLRTMKRESRARDLTRADVHRCMDQLRRGTLSPRMQRHIFASLRALCNFAVGRGYMPSSPCAGVKPPKVSAPAQRAVMTVEEMDILRTRAADDSEPLASLIAVLCETAMRPSEARALQWKDLQRQASGAWVLHVAHAMSRTLGGGEMRGTTKTGKARTVTLRPAFGQALAARRGDAPDDAYLWPHSRDTRRPVSERTLSRCLKSVAERAGLEPNLAAYAIRHSESPRWPQPSLTGSRDQPACRHIETDPLGDLHPRLPQRREYPCINQ